VAKELDQSERRRPIVLLDDFIPPRKWESTIDIISQGTCAPINPKGWNDPLDTPQSVLIAALWTDPESGRPALALREQYENWRDDLKKKHVEYDQKLYGDAMMLFGAEGPSAYEERKPALVNYTGPGPQAWEPIEAALQGNSAALGRKPLSSDPRIAKYFVKKQTTTLDFADDSLADLEEDIDPQATGGKTQKIPKKRSLAEV
jgi:hypothetical protein